MLRRQVFRSILLTLTVLLSGIPLAAVAETLKLGGTGSALSTMQLLADAFQKSEPQFSLRVVPNLGSTGGIKALAAGVLDIAVASRLPREAESAQGLVGREYGKTPFVLATSKKGVTNLTIRQLVAIYSGVQATWEDGSPIRLILRPATDGDTHLLGSFSDDMQQALHGAMAREGMIIALTDQDSANEIQRLPGALGTSSLALLLAEKRPLTPLAIDGVFPSVEAIANGSYHYIKPIFVITKGAPTGLLARFVNFIFSLQGRTMLHETGYWVENTSSPKP